MNDQPANEKPPIKVMAMEQIDLRPAISSEFITGRFWRELENEKLSSWDRRRDIEAALSEELNGG